MAFVYFRTFLIVALLAFANFAFAEGQNFASEPAAKLLPNVIGDNRSAGEIGVRKAELFDEKAQRMLTSWASRDYSSKDRTRFSVTVLTTTSDSTAYSVLADTRLQVKSAPEGNITTANVGTDGFYFWDGGAYQLNFFKGNTYVSVRDDGTSKEATPLLNFGRALAETIDRGEGEIPVLTKHLPDWTNVQDRASYLVTKDDLTERFYAYKTVLDVVSFEGGAAAVAADYDGPELLIIEFYTPQLASDNDRRIIEQISESRSQGQPVPTAYRRVGNYSVFVFDAASEQAANQLIDQVKYQQVVQWLGKNPHLYDDAANEFTQTTLGVFVAVVKASGLALIATLAIGGLFGAILFGRRRSQKQALEAYTDAGGMLRLNLDEITPTTDPTRLLGPGN